MKPLPVSVELVWTYLNGITSYFTQLDENHCPIACSIFFFIKLKTLLLIFCVMVCQKKTNLQEPTGPMASPWVWGACHGVCLQAQARASHGLVGLSGSFTCRTSGVCSGSSHERLVQRLLPFIEACFHFNYQSPNLAWIFRTCTSVQWIPNAGFSVLCNLV